MISCHIDKQIFYSTTGVEFGSELGCIFLTIAIRNLESIREEIESSTEHIQLVHKIKGIASSCGLVEVESLCKQIERYKTVIKSKMVIALLDKIILIMIITLKDSNEI